MRLKGINLPYYGLTGGSFWSLLLLLLLFFYSYYYHYYFHFYNLFFIAIIIIIIIIITVIIIIIISKHKYNPNAYRVSLINNGNRIEWNPIQSVIIQVINKIGQLQNGSPIC